MRCLRLASLIVLVSVCLAFSNNVAVAATNLQTQGQDYIVQAGDSLTKLAVRFYGDAKAWRVIYEGTNAKAASDPSYARIENPNIIHIGQKLWIPDRNAAAPPANDPQALQAAYDLAVQDAAIAEPHEVSRNLIAIIPSEPGLIWNGDSGTQRVLMVTWTSWQGYNSQVGQAVTLDPSRVMWVSAAPEVRNFCQAYLRQNPNGDLDLRLRQLLGLPPADQKTTFVEFWVDPSRMFRPSPDPEITDHEAELDFRQSEAVATSSSHIEWFNQLREVSYLSPGYPWTRLGYTYDWGNPESEIGVSEFVISGGSNLQVHASYTTQEYCR